ncbi:MAG: cyclic nucleotide-binding domain-containing protein [Cyanobacteria bacterium SID2]|nr:cyclic nucleotide-binding domain-containing protein [Cyanobacteria bacterium SID2]
METQNRVSTLLKYTTLGRNFSDAEIQKLLELGTICEADTGSLLCVEGTPSDSLFVLLEGEAELLKNDSDGQQVVLGTVSQGETIGEIGLVLDYPRLGSVRTTRPSQVFVLHRTEFDRLFHSSRVGIKLSLRLSELAHRHLQTLVEGTSRLVADYAEALEALDRLRNMSPESDTLALREALAVQSDRLRQQQHQLKHQLFQLQTQREQTRTLNRGLQITLGVVVGIAAISTALYFSGAFDRLRRAISDSPHPTVRPEITEQSQCTGDGRYWYDGQCFDFTHDPAF